MITTHGRNNHSVRSERWRLIRYSDGTEEFYDHQSDPMEWTNLAGDPKHAAEKNKLAAWLPKVNVEEGPRTGKRPAKNKTPRTPVKSRRPRSSAKDS